MLEPAEVRAAIDSVTLDDLKRAGQGILASGASAAAMLGPKGAAGAPQAFVDELAAG